MMMRVRSCCSAHVCLHSDEYEQLYPDSGPILSLREARAAPRDLRERFTDVRIGAHVTEAMKQKYLDQVRTRGGRWRDGMCLTCVLLVLHVSPAPPRV